MQLVEADASQLPFEDQSFDAIACNFGVLHLAHPEAQSMKAFRNGLEAFFAESMRLLRPNGRLAFTAWAPLPATEAMALVHEAVALQGDATVPLPAAPPFFRFGDPAECAEALQGFVDVASAEAKTRWVYGPGGQVAMWWDFKAAEELFVAFRDGTGRTAELLARQTPQQLAGIERHVTRGAEAKRSGASRAASKRSSSRIMSNYIGSKWL